MAINAAGMTALNTVSLYISRCFKEICL